MKKFIDVMKIAFMSVVIGLALVFSYNISMALFIFACLIIVFLVAVVIKSIYSIKASGKNEYQILYETVNNMWKDKDSEKCLKVMRKSKINHDSISYKSDLALIHYCNGDEDEAKKLLFELESRCDNMESEYAKSIIGIRFNMCFIESSIFADQYEYKKAYENFKAFIQKYKGIVEITDMIKYWMELYKDLSEENYKKANLETIDKIYKTISGISEEKCGILNSNRADIYKVRILKKLNKIEEADALLEGLKERKLLLCEKKLVEELIIER